MALFTYKASDPSGKVVTGVLEAEAERAAAGRLQEMGYIPIRISLQKQGLSSYMGDLRQFLKIGRRRIRLAELVTFTQDFSFLLASGLPVDKALTIQAQVLENSSFRDLVDDLLRRVKGGAYLSDALARHKDVFSELYRNMVKTGESAGRLAESLGRLAGFLKEMQELRNHIISALIYPVFVLMVSGLSIVILLIFVIPKFSVVFSDTGQAMPLPTQILLLSSELLRSTWPFLIIGIIGLVFLIQRYVRTARGRARMDRYKMAMPLVGNLLREMEVARFARTLGVLLSSSVPILQALSMAEESINNQTMRGAMMRITEMVREGDSLSVALKTVEGFPQLALQMIVTGEETGQLDQMLLRVADHYENTMRETIRRLISLLEPIIILIMGFLVGVVVISMLLGIFSINELPF
jgi:type II secretory pathway component PulF